MNAVRSPRSHEALTGQQTLTNWLALVALLALGIVWPPGNTAPAGVRAHAVVTDEAPTPLQHRACAPRSAR